MTLRSVNPESGEAGALVLEAAPADIAHAVTRAATAFPHWSSASGRSRGRLIREMADQLESRRSSIIKIAHFETALGHDRLGHCRRFRARHDGGQGNG